jgi:hypothetical protein
MPTVQERARYQSDFGVSWLRLPILVAASLLTAIVVAWCLQFALVHGWYLIILLPAAGGALLAGVLYALTGWAHCRNFWLASVVAVLAGFLAYLGYYHFGLIEELPPGNAWRVDLLPQYILFRMQTDVAEDVGKPKVNPQAKKPLAFLNYMTFAWELLTIVGLAAAFSWKRARHAYCTELGQWMRQETALLVPHSSTNFLAALDKDTLPQFVAQTSAGNDPQTSSRLILEYAVPKTGSPLEFPLYASFEDLPVAPPWYRPRLLRRTFVRQVELELAEVLALRPLFPKLTRLLESQHTELRDLPADVPTAPTPPLPVSDVAEITPVPEPYRRRVRGKGYALRTNLLGLTPVISIFAGMGLVVAGVWLLREGSFPLGCAAIALGAAGIFWGIYLGLFCLAVPENRWIERRLRQEIGQRAEKLVDPQDPESIYVSLIPRESFAKIQWTMSSDLLLLKVDKNRRRLLMEGDSDRYCIPAGAISVCEPQCFFHPLDQQRRNQLWMVRLMIRVKQGWQELLLSVGNTRWSPMTNARRRHIAEDTCQRITELGA